jgi:hypothetical protein
LHPSHQLLNLRLQFGLPRLLSLQALNGAVQLKQPLVLPLQTCLEYLKFDLKGAQLAVV